MNQPQLVFFGMVLLFIAGSLVIGGDYDED